MMRCFSMVLAIVALVGCGGPDAFMTEASALAEAALQQDKARNYESALARREQALALLARIELDHPSSDAARSIKRGAARVGPHPVAEFRETIVPRSRLTVRAMSEPAACAVHLAATIKEAAARDRASSAVAAVLGAEAAHKALARRAALSIRPGQDRVDALLATGALSDGLTAARGLSSVQQRWRAVYSAVLAMAKAKQFNEAVAAARSNADPRFRAKGLSELAFALAAEDRGDEASIVLDEALKAARLVSEPQHQAELLANIGDIYARGGAIGGAQRLLGQATQVAAGLPVGPKERLLLPIVKTLASLPDITGTLRAVSAMADPEQRGQALVAVAGVWATTDGTGRGLTSAIEIAADLKVDEARSAALAALAGAQSRLGDAVAARKTAERIRVPEVRAEAIIEIAARHKTPALWAAARDQASRVFEDHKRAAMLARLAAALGRAGDMAGGNTVLEQAWKAAESGPNTAARVRRLLAIAEAASAVKQKTVARAALKRAAALAAGIKDPLTRASEHSHITLIYALGGHHAQAGKAMLIAIREGGTLQFEGTKVRLMLGLARLFERIGPQASAAALEPMRAVVDGIEEPARRTGLALLVARGFAAQRRYQDAAGLLGSVGSSAERAEVLSAVAVEAARVDGADQGITIAKRVQRVEVRARTLAAIALAASGGPGGTGRDLLRAFVMEAPQP